jgi:uncharacterized membrane protein YphA (DoxX/SURF4 family)
VATEVQTLPEPILDTTWKGRLLTGLLAVQIVVGFEFLWTVLTKLVRGGFVAGLSADLWNRVQAAPAWYHSLADSFIIPHATVFAYLVIIGELFVGVTLIAGAVVWLARWDKLSLAAQRTLVTLILLAAAAALTMNLNYHIANGAANPWQLPTEVFDEGVDINTVLALIDATIVVVMAFVLASLRRRRA